MNRPRICRDSFIAPISPVTHDCESLPWYKGAGFYGCIVDEAEGITEWHGPYATAEEARQKFGDVVVHGNSNQPYEA